MNLSLYHLIYLLRILDFYDAPHVGKEGQQFFGICVACFVRGRVSDILTCVPR
jgi:hypothetical protein